MGVFKLLSDEWLRRKLAAQKWTAHNVALNKEVTTIPGEPDFLKTNLRLLAILRTLSLLYRGRLADLRVADLGCLEGGFALALAQRGMDVVGIEARAKNLKKAEFLAKYFKLPNLKFELGDVKNFTRETFGDFDVVLALGILYHLDEPTAWLRQIAQATRSVLVIDSHYAPADDASLALIDKRIAQLSALEPIEDQGRTYEGRWFFEYGENVDVEGEVWSAYSNQKSFWLTKESLLSALSNAGFDLVYEQHDYYGLSYARFTAEFPRVMFVAVKGDSFVGQ
jgi:SAM-dependent methyltransferase